MGRVRPTYIKRTARDLLEQFPDKFSSVYEKNLAVISDLASISSKSLRNRVAGYITTLVRQKESGRVHRGYAPSPEDE